MGVPGVGCRDHYGIDPVFFDHLFSAVPGRQAPSARKGVSPLFMVTAYGDKFAVGRCAQCLGMEGGDLAVSY